jgi:hypothetical protein
MFTGNLATLETKGISIAIARGASKFRDPTVIFDPT